MSGLPGGAGPGVVVHDELIEFEILDAGGTFALYKGVLQSRVVQLDASGTLAFESRIRDTDGSLNGAVVRITGSSFAGFYADVEYDSTGLGDTGPSRATRTNDGVDVSFDFSPAPVLSGRESKWTFVATDAISFAKGGRTTITVNTGESVVMPTVQPFLVDGRGCERIDFEDRPVGASFPPGSAFVSGGVLIRVHEFFFGPAVCVNPFFEGMAQIDGGNLACREGNDLQVANVNVEFDYGVPLDAIEIHYGEYGGTVNLSVNGDCVVAAGFAGIPPFLGGTVVTVTEFDENCGMIRVEGIINEIMIGGQEFWIDDVFCEVDPCDEDDGPPVAEITAPTDFACVCDPVQIFGTADDANFGHYALEYRRPAEANWTPIVLSNVPVVNGLLGVLNAAGFAQGYYFLRLTVTDECGNASTAVRIVWLGTTFDNLTIRSPNDGDILGGLVCIDGTVSDNICFDSYVAEWQLVGTGIWNPFDPGNPVYTSPIINDPIATWDTLGDAVNVGDYLIKVEAVDDCGNDARVVREIIIDNKAPIADISQPTPCDNVEGIVSVFGTAFDDNLASWSLQYTGGANPGWVTIATGNTNVVNDLLADWDTTKLEPCAYTLRLVVTDKAVLNCNGALHHQTIYLVSVSVGEGLCGDCDGDGDVDLEDWAEIENNYTGP